MAGEAVKLSQLNFIVGLLSATVGGLIKNLSLLKISLPWDCETVELSQWAAFVDTR